jgi:hypothetical protein
MTWTNPVAFWQASNIVASPTFISFIPLQGDFTINTTGSGGINLPLPVFWETYTTSTGPTSETVFDFVQFSGLNANASLNGWTNTVFIITLFFPYDASDYDLSGLNAFTDNLVGFSGTFNGPFTDANGNSYAYLIGTILADDGGFSASTFPDTVKLTITGSITTASSFVDSVIWVSLQGFVTSFQAGTFFGLLPNIVDPPYFFDYNPGVVSGNDYVFGTPLTPPGFTYLGCMLPQMVQWQNTGSNMPLTFTVRAFSPATAWNTEYTSSPSFLVVPLQQGTSAGSGPYSTQNVFLWYFPVALGRNPFDSNLYTTPASAYQEDLVMTTMDQIQYVIHEWQ